MPKISVIIPVYNAEKYLAKSIESVLNQSLKDIEVICIDDGSTDKSLEILENYADKDKRIKIFRQKQSGPANARNLGIDNSSSDIITFLDADDWVYSENSYEKIYNEMKADNLDLLAYNHYEYNNELAALLPDALRKYIFEYDDEDYNKVLLKDDFSKYVFKFSPFPWDKFYKKNLLIDNNIKFPLNLPAGEDSASAALNYMKKSGINKKAYFIDTYEGFNYDEAFNSNDTYWKSGHTDTSLERVSKRLEKYSNAKLVKGNIIKDELPEEIKQICVVNIDVDLYEAVKAALYKVKDKVVTNGIIIAEDYGHTPTLIGGQKAVQEFIEDNKNDFIPLYLNSGQMFLIKK